MAYEKEKKVGIVYGNYWKAFIKKIDKDLNTAEVEMLLYQNKTIADACKQAYITPNSGLYKNTSAYYGINVMLDRMTDTIDISDVVVNSGNVTNEKLDDFLLGIIYIKTKTGYFLEEVIDSEGNIELKPYFRNAKII